jgi:D-galactarolactone cycloisomerase
VKIASIEPRVYRYAFDPPFVAAWDPEPRTHQVATIVVVRSDDGSEGSASGDAVPDRELLERLLIGVDASATDTVHELLETVDLHHGRNWIVEVAVWDLLARADDEPLWRMLGGDRDRILAYASTGELVDAEERVRRSRALGDSGITATKIRLHSQDWRIDLPVI